MPMEKRPPGIGSDLRNARRAAHLTQAGLAEKLDVSVPSVRQAEQDRGGLAVFMAAASYFGLVFVGRGLPAGGSLAERLKTLRKRRGISQRSLASLAMLSPTTLAAFEVGSVGHLSTSIALADALGVRLRLARADDPPDFYTTTAASSVHQGWTTPQALLGLLYDVIGGQFDLDPCSSTRRGATAPVRARQRFTAEDDGLSLSWTKAMTVFMNPPYGRSLKAWVAKAHSEALASRTTTVFGLVPARSDTSWWHQHVAVVADIWHLRGRLCFGDGGVPAPFPSAVVVWNANEVFRAGMKAAFAGAWHVRAAELDRLAAD